MATIEDITALSTEAEMRLAQAREMTTSAAEVLKQYNPEMEGNLDEDLFRETIEAIDSAMQALPSAIID